MEVSFQDVSLFRYLFAAVARFVDQVHFDVGSEGIRIKSIDPHDFCYIDLLMYRNFFREFVVEEAVSFSIPIDKFNTFLPKISDAKQIILKTNESDLEIIASKDWNMSFKINFLESDLYDLPEPRKIDYEAYVVVTAKEFSKLIESASTISNELKIILKDNMLYVNSISGNYSFSGQPSQIIESGGEKDFIESYVISSYLRYLSSLIKKCDRIKIHLGEEKPVKFDLIYKEKASFSFTLSQRKRKILRMGGAGSRGGTSLPRLTVSKLPEFLLYISNTPSGERTRILVSVGLETTGGDYSRMALKLGFASRKKGRLIISEEGLTFVNLLKNDPKYSKEFLHKVASSKISAYDTMIKIISIKPLGPDELFKEINDLSRSKDEYTIDKQDLNTLLGLAMWCGKIDKKLALYYFEDGVGE